MKKNTVAFDVICEALELACFIVIMSSPLLYLCRNCLCVCACALDSPSCGWQMLWSLFGIDFTACLCFLPSDAPFMWTKMHWLDRISCTLFK